MLAFSLSVMLVIIDFIDSIPGAVSSGFILTPLAVLLLFVLIFIFYYALQEAKIRLLQATLIASFVFVVVLIAVRYSKITSEQICFLQADKPTFIVKLKDRNFVFYADKEANSDKATFMAKSFQKIYPGEIHTFEISTKKTTQVKLADKEIFIERQKGGYAIHLDNQDFFLATSLSNNSPLKTKIYSSWISDSELPFHLKNNFVQFKLN